MTDQPLEPSEPTGRTEPPGQTEQPTQATPPPPAPPQSTPSQRLRRSRDDRVLAGVCGGLGEYFGIEAVLVRIAFVLLIFAGGLGILAYGLLWIFVPDEPSRPGETTDSALDRAVGAVGEDRRSGALVVGLIFVGLGVLFLLDIAWPNFLSWRYLWPTALIAVGVAIVLRARR